LPDEAADQLYALRPADFTAARDALARAEADRVTAVAIKSLRKPSLVAWALNQLVRQERSSVEELIALGNELREAQAALEGDALRALGRQRHQLVRAVAGQAAQVAHANGHPLSPALVDQVATSLDAALTDPGNAAQLLSGRLTGALEYAGLGEAPAPTLTIVRDKAKKPVAAMGTATEKAAAKAAERAREKEVKLAQAAIAAAEREFVAAERVRLKAREVLAATHLRAGIAQEALQAANEEWDNARADEDAAVLAEHKAAKSSEIASLRLEQARAHASTLDP
jgi:hypothetical protein